MVWRLFYFLQLSHLSDWCLIFSTIQLCIRGRKLFRCWLNAISDRQEPLIKLLITPAVFACVPQLIVNSVNELVLQYSKNYSVFLSKANENVTQLFVALHCRLTSSNITANILFATTTSDIDFWLRQKLTLLLCTLQVCSGFHGFLCVCVWMICRGLKKYLCLGESRYSIFGLTGLASWPGLDTQNLQICAV